MKKDASPHKYRVEGPNILGGYTWKAIQFEGDTVYEREFWSTKALEEFLDDRYGKKFSKKILDDVKAFKS